MNINDKKDFKLLIKIEFAILLLLIFLSLAAKGTQVYAPFFTIGNKLKTKFLEITGNYINFSKTTGQSGYGFRDSSGVMQFRNSADSRWRVMADTVGGTGDEVTIHKDGGTGELSVKSDYKSKIDTSYVLWMGFSSDNPMLYDGMRNQMFYGNRVSIYDSAGYDKILHYAKSNSTELFTIVITDTIFHRGINDTIPNNIYLIVQDRAGIWMNSTDSLYFDCFVEAGRYAIFLNDFYLTCTTGNSRMRTLYPEWFEVPVNFTTNPPNSTTDLIECFITADRFIPCTVEFGPGYRYKTDSLWVPELVNWISSALSFLYLGDNAADTSIWIGGDDPGWNIPYGVGDVTTSVIRNIYIKGGKYSAAAENVVVFLKRPAIGHVWENVQIWSGERNGLEIYRPNAGPLLTNVWCDDNKGTGIKVWGGAGNFYFASIFLEQNAQSSPGYYQLEVNGVNYGYIGYLHTETGYGDNDTLIHSTASSSNYIGLFQCGGTGDSIVVFSAPDDWNVGMVSPYSWSGLTNDSLMFGGAGGTYSMFSRKGTVFGWTNNSLGIGPVWRTSIGGASDMNFMPGDTIPNWNGYTGFFTRRNNQTGLGGIYNTGLIYPLYYVNNNGIVRPTLSGVPYSAITDTLPALNFTGDTNASDSLSTLLNWIQTSMITQGRIPGKFFRKLFEYEQ